MPNIHIHGGTEVNKSNKESGRPGQHPPMHYKQRTDLIEV